MKIYSLFSLLLVTTTLLPAAEPTTIHEECKKGDIAAVQRFIECDPTSINKRDNDQNTPLHMAIIHSFIIVIHHHPYPGASPSEIEEINKRNAIPQEIFQTHAAIVKMLLDHSALVNLKNNLGRTPLHEAASIADEYFIRLLIKHGASINLKTNRDETAADLADDNRWYPDHKVANFLRYYAALLAFCCALHPRIGAPSTPAILPQPVMQEILSYLQPSDFAKKKLY